MRHKKAPVREMPPNRGLALSSGHHPRVTSSLALGSLQPDSVTELPLCGLSPQPLFVMGVGPTFLLSESKGMFSQPYTRYALWGEDAVGEGVPTAQGCFSVSMCHSATLYKLRLLSLWDI